MTLQKNKDRLVKYGELVTNEWLVKEINRCLAKIKKNMLRYGNDFPSACGTNGVYRIKPNDDWTNGFWTGMLWIAYEWSHEKLFLNQAMENIKSFQQRLDDHLVLDHHDIGFLYSLSAGAGYKVTGDDRYKQQLLEASDLLMARFQPNGDFIQAWGKYGAQNEYRLIIDSLINLPLLLEASVLSGESKYKEIALKHYHTLLRTVIREDNTTYHTYYFDTETGVPTHGVTHQGHSDNSIWARGQSWAILGIPLVESYLEDSAFPENYKAITDVFIEHLPKDLVPYWDFDFGDRNPSAKDSSSLAIAACGLLEADKINMYPQGREIAKGMIYQLREHYSSVGLDENEGLLIHGVYAHGEGKGIDEPNLWGDYFYLEALMRLVKPDWEKYW